MGNEQSLGSAALVSMILVAGCFACDSGLNSIPSTFAGTLLIQPKGRQTKELYSALLNLGDAYGLRSSGDGGNGGTWQIQVFCGRNLAASATTTLAGDLVLFDAYVYAFKRPGDYERYKSETLRLMKEFGSVTRQVERGSLAKEDLLARGRHMGLDVTSQCGVG